MFTYEKDDSIIKKIITITTWIIGGIILAVLFGLLVGFLVMYLWNWLMPMLFGLKTITFWQAFGLVVLAKILFGSFGGHGKDEKHHGKDCSGKFKFHKMSHKEKKYYHDFWNEEGEAAFDRYMENVKTDESKNVTSENEDKE